MALSSFKTMVQVGDVIDISDKRTKEKKDGRISLTVDINSPEKMLLIRLMIADPENWMFENKGKVTEIRDITFSATPKRKGGFFYNVYANVVMEKTTEKPTKKSEIVLPGSLRKKPSEPKLFTPPTLTSESIPVPAENPAKPSDYGIALDGFLDALHDEDLSGVKSCEEDLPFN